jgi:rubrerythrin
MTGRFQQQRRLLCFQWMANWQAPLATSPAASPSLPSVGRLPDGTPYFAPIGEVPYDPDEDRVQCHLCGGWFKLIGSTHLSAGHGWTIDMYREAFGLLRLDATCSRGLSRTLARNARARHATGVLKPGRGYAKPLGSPGRPVRPTESLGALHPELVAELDPEHAHDVDPFRLGPRSGRKLWWRCPECDHTWSAAPHERVIGGGCPVCDVARRAEANRQVSYERSLAAKRPELLRELHPTRNAALDPSKLGAGSGQMVWWRCPECGHDWKADPATRARGRGCPACARRRQARLASQQRSIVPRERSIAVLRPELASELHPARNGDLDPFTTAAYSNRPLWWLCSTCGTVWKQAPYARWKPGRCPACRA